jgi:hypothetical protein
LFHAVRTAILTREIPNFTDKKAMMPKPNVYRERTSAWFTIGAILIIVAGIGLIRLSEGMAIYPTWKPVVANVGGLIVASVGLGVIWELVGKRALIAEIFESAKVSQEVQAAKITGVTTRFQEGVAWTEILDGAERLDLFVTAGRTWRSSFSHSLKSLAENPNAKGNRSVLLRHH